MGYDVHFGTNYMGLGLLTQLLLDVLKYTVKTRSPDMRAITVPLASESMAPN